MKFYEDNVMEQEIIYFEDLKGNGQSAGWAGYETGKSENDLMSEVMIALSRLGGERPKWRRGVFEDGRFGYTLEFFHESGAPGILKITAMRLKTKPSSSTYDRLKEKSLKMALFNLRDQLESMWRMQQLIPGYFGLMPMILTANGQTLGELYSDRLNLPGLLPDHVLGESEIVDGEIQS